MEYYHPVLTQREILERLKALREEKKLRQEAVARRLGIARTTYVRKESGAIPITTEEWLKLSEALNKDPSYFFRPDGLKGAAREGLILKLYELLRNEEKEALLTGIESALRHVEREPVRRTIELLKGPGEAP